MLIPIEIKKIKDPAGQTDFRVVVNIEDAFRYSNTREQLKRIEEEYAEFVEQGKKLVTEIQKSKINKADTKLHWALGDLAVQFLQRTRKKGYFLANTWPTLSRDLGLSPRYFGYHIQLREDYPSVELIHDEISWSKYQELLDIESIRNRNICINKILKGEITTRKELRAFKKNLNR